MSDPTTDKKSGDTPRWTARRIIALIAIILLVGMYVVTLIAAMFSSPSTSRLFRFCLGMTIAVPIFAWIGIYAAGYITHRHTIASADILNSNRRERKKMEAAVAEEMEREEQKAEDPVSDPASTPSLASSGKKKGKKEAGRK